MLEAYASWDATRIEELPPYSPTKIPSGSIPELFKLTGDSREAKVWEMTMAGFKNAQIARMFGLSERTIMRIRSAFVHRNREVGLRQDTALSMVAEEVAKLDEIERVMLQEASQITSGGKRYNPATGMTEVVEGQGDIRNKERFIRCAMDAGEKRRKLLIDVGIIPKDPDRVITAIAPVEVVELKGDNELSTDELRQRIMSTISRTRFIQ